MSAQSGGSGSSESSDFLETLKRDLPITIPRLFAAEGLVAVNLTQIGCGLSNIVFSFRCLTLELPDGEMFVIRVQFFPIDSSTEIEIKNQAAILQMLMPVSSLVPKFIRMDTTANNPIQRAYMITSFLEGTVLEKVCSDICLSEEIEICKTVASELHRIQSVKFTATGPLEAYLSGHNILKVGRFQDNRQPLPDLDDDANPLLKT